MMIIDATDLLLGRLATVAAKRALLGEEVIVVNCENAIVSGKKDNVFAKYKQRRDRGSPSTGPYFPRYPEQIVKRTIRGMLPYKQPKGRDALKRVKCFRGMPSEYEGKAESIKEAHAGKLTTLNFVVLKEISKFLGAKI